MPKNNNAYESIVVIYILHNKLFEKKIMKIPILHNLRSNMIRFTLSMCIFSQMAQTMFEVTLDLFISSRHYDRNDNNYSQLRTASLVVAHVSCVP